MHDDDYQTWAPYFLHSTNKEITQAKKRDTTYTEIEKLEEKIALGAKKFV